MAVTSQRTAPQLYKDSLTPALHRRFTRAAGIALLTCYVESVCIADKSSLIWSWFPLGPAGIRTLLLFISALAVFVLRVAQLHIGARITPSPLHTLRYVLFSLNAIQTLAWYLFSAWWFSEVYVWSFPRDAQMSWIVQAGPYDRPQLNERPIYLRTNFYILAVIQTCWHLYYDYDLVVLPIQESHSETTPDGKLQVTTPSPEEQLKSKLPRRAERTFLRSLCMVIVGPLIYQLFLRRMVWEWTMLFAVRIWTLPRSSSIPPTVLPYHISVILRTVTSSYMLLMLWEISILSFGIYVAQEPLKRDKPLTDYSRDPNGTLLTGLRSKRDVSQSFAFWELLIICKRFPTRRQSFFEDIDRKGGATWTQLLNVCLGIIQSMNARVTRAMNPPNSTTTSAPSQQSQQLTIQQLPRITATPLKEAQIFTNTPLPATRREKVQERVGTFAKSQGQSPPETRKGWTPLDLLSYVYHQLSNKLLTPEQKQLLSTTRLANQINENTLSFLRTPLGFPFRQPLRRRAISTLLDTPLSNIDIPISAITSLTKLATSSLKEDPFGKVSPDVPLLIRTFRDTITTLESFKQTFRPHWTDVQARDQGVKPEDFQEVDIMLAVLRKALRELIDAFERYADTLKLSVKEMSAARRVAGMDS